MTKGYPKYQKTAEKGERGVQLVTEIVMHKLGWIFKRNHQEFDFGIDGQIEIVRNDSAVTGQIIAVQIKYGNSFFTEKNRWGYIYRGELKHFNYLANYPTPILIIICKPSTQEAYWELFEPIKTERTSKAWKITIPKNQKLAESKNQILELLSGEVDYLSSLETYWGVNKILNEYAEIIHFVITPDEINDCDISDIYNNFKRLTTSKELAFQSQGRVEFSFMGYDSDPRELFEVPEVIKFSQKMAQAIPELFFFSNTEEFSGGLRTVALCHADAKIVNNKSQVLIDQYKMIPFITNQINGLEKTSKWLGMDLDEFTSIKSNVLKHLEITIFD